MSKKKTRGSTSSKMLNEPQSDVMIALLEMFSVVDDVLTEEDAFDANKLQAGMGRIYRQWMRTRTVLDPNFDKTKYQHGTRSKRPAKGQQVFTMGQRVTLEKSQKPSAKKGKERRKRDV